MKLTFVYAQDQRGGIGKDNRLPWHLPKELQHFKRVTMGHTIVMGRKTFESMNQRLLPGRKTVVVTRQKDYGHEIPELEVVHTIDDLFKRSESELMIIGGAGLYEELWEHATKIERTVIDGVFDCDTFVPELDEELWQRVDYTFNPKNDQNTYSYTFETWVKK